MKTYPLISILILTTLLAMVATAQPGQRHRGGSQLWTGLASDFDHDSNGEITLDEFGGAGATFENMDRNGDGVISQSDFERGGGMRGKRDGERRMRSPRMDRGMVGGMAVRLADGDRDGTITTAELDAFLAELDANGDGLIEADELRAVFSRGERGPGEDRPRGANPFDHDADGDVEVEDFQAIFAELDDNSDGELSGEELPRFPGHRRGPSGGFLVRGADSDEDGDITSGEWQDQVARFDANGDGTIDEAEWLAAAHVPSDRVPSDREPPPDFFAMVTQHLDRNDNGVLETSDLDAIFAEHDADGNGVIEESELPDRGWRGRGRRGGRA